MRRVPLSFSLSETNHVRVKCKHCGVITEIPCSDIYLRFRNSKCLHCHTEYHLAGDQANSPFAHLQMALDGFRAIEGKVLIEFVLSDQDKKIPDHGRYYWLDEL